MGLRQVCNGFKMGMGLERSHQRYAIVYIKTLLIQASAFILRQGFEEYRHLCDQIGHILMDIVLFRYFGYHLLAFFSIFHLMDRRKWLKDTFLSFLFLRSSGSPGEVKNMTYWKTN